MIDTEVYDRQLVETLTWEDYHAYKNLAYRLKYQNRNEPPPIGKDNTRNSLFWNRRYQIGSYKARKAGITQPPSVMMKYSKEKFRLYGDPETNKLFGAMTENNPVKEILAGWKKKNKALLRALKVKYKEWLKANGVYSKTYSFETWLHTEYKGGY